MFPSLDWKALSAAEKMKSFDVHTNCCLLHIRFCPSIFFQDSKQCSVRDGNRTAVRAGVTTSAAQMSEEISAAMKINRKCLFGFILFRTTDSVSQWWWWTWRWLERTKKLHKKPPYIVFCSSEEYLPKGSSWSVQKAHSETRKEELKD